MRSKSFSIPKYFFPYFLISGLNSLQNMEVPCWLAALESRESMDSPKCRVCDVPVIILLIVHKNIFLKTSKFEQCTAHRKPAFLQPKEYNIINLSSAVSHSTEGAFQKKMNIQLILFLERINYYNSKVQWKLMFVCSFYN